MWKGGGVCGGGEYVEGGGSMWTGGGGRGEGGGNSLHLVSGQRKKRSCSSRAAVDRSVGQEAVFSEIQWTSGSG